MLFTMIWLIFKRFTFGFNNIAVLKWKINWHSQKSNFGQLKCTFNFKLHYGLCANFYCVFHTFRLLSFICMNCCPYIITNKWLVHITADLNENLAAEERAKFLTQGCSDICMSNTCVRWVYCCIQVAGH